MPGELLHLLHPTQPPCHHHHYSAATRTSWPTGAYRAVYLDVLGMPLRQAWKEVHVFARKRCAFTDSMKRKLMCNCSKIRVVSICENKARFLLANFSQGYLRYLARIKAIKGLPVTADINVGPYYDIDKLEDFRQFMRKLADVPICPPVYGS